MPYNGSGTFTRLYDWTTRRDAGLPTLKIDADTMDAEMDGMATGLSNALCKDGQSTPSANITLGGFRITSLGDATARTDAAKVSQIQDSGYVWIAGGGTVDAITATYAPALTALTNGCLVGFRCAGANTVTTPTFAPNGLTAKTIVKGANAALAAGDLVGNHAEYFLRYNSTLDKWVLLNPASGAVAASDTVAGIVELATAAETTTGTDAARAVTPDGLAGSDYGKRAVTLLVSDPNGSAITTGNGKSYWRVPAILNGYNLVAVGMALTTASSSGIPTVQIANVTQAVDMLTTSLTVDASETDSSTAAAAAVIDTANDDVATGDQLRIDIDVAGTGAKGLIVDLTFQLP